MGWQTKNVYPVVHTKIHIQSWTAEKWMVHKPLQMPLLEIHKPSKSRDWAIPLTVAIQSQLNPIKIIKSQLKSHEFPLNIPVNPSKAQ